jgi:hypothetical protein
VTMLTSMLTTALWLAGAAASSVPIDGAENARTRPPGGGIVAPGPDGAVTLPSLMAALKADALQRTGGDAARLTVQPPEEVVWSDGALGCPQPGRLYTQALVPGWRVRIDVAGAPTLVYHASQRGQWLLCPAGRARSPLPGPATR